MSKKGINSDVYSAFKNKEEKISYTGNLESIRGQLISFGWAILAVWNYGKKKPLILLNGDKFQYTGFGPNHQNDTFCLFNDSPRVAFSALEAAEIDPKFVKIKDYTTDEYNYYDLSHPDFDNVEKMMKPGSMLIINKDRDGKIVSKRTHRMGSSLLEHNDEHYLCGVDEYNYFVSKLPHKTRNIDSAYQSLKPKRVKKYEKQGVNVRRQGEWFCIPVSEITDNKKKIKKIKKRMEKRFVLPNNGGNLHVLTKGCKYGKNYYGVGTMRHQNGSGWNTGEHKMLRLGYNDIFMFIKNTSLADWSADGNID